MWWREVAALQSLKLLPMTGREWSQVEIHPTAIIDETLGPVRIGPGTKVCAGAYVAGPASIGANCLVGNHTMLRGPFLIGDRVRIGLRRRSSRLWSTTMWQLARNASWPTAKSNAVRISEHKFEPRTSA